MPLPYRSRSYILTAAILAIASLIMTCFLLDLRTEDGSERLTRWVREAPLESVSVQDGDKGWLLLSERLPEEARQVANKGELLYELEARTGENLSEIGFPEAVLLPIPYEEWAETQR